MKVSSLVKTVWQFWNSELQPFLYKNLFNVEKKIQQIKLKLTGNHSILVKKYKPNVYVIDYNTSLSTHDCLYLINKYEFTHFSLKQFVIS